MGETVRAGVRERDHAAAGVASITDRARAREPAARHGASDERRRHRTSRSSRSHGSCIWHAFDGLAQAPATPTPATTATAAPAMSPQPQSRRGCSFRRVIQQRRGGFAGRTPPVGDRLRFTTSISSVTSTWPDCAEGRAYHAGHRFVFRAGSELPIARAVLAWSGSPAAGERFVTHSAVSPCGADYCIRQTLR